MWRVTQIVVFHPDEEILKGRVRIAQMHETEVREAEFDRIDLGKQTFWALDDEHRDQLLKQHAKSNSKPSITRFKGLGEMNPDTLKMTTLDPRTRQPLRVTVKDGEQLLTDQVISDLMGKDVAARFKMITENAADIGELDV